MVHWLSLNLHTVDEDVMKKLFVFFHQLNFYDPLTVVVAERFLKAKEASQELLTALANYCFKFRIFSPDMFDAMAEGFIAAGTNVTLPTVEAILTTFGLLDYRPKRAFDFWILAESILDEKFIQFRPESILDILLSCVYLERYPLNFTGRLYSPHFLHRLNCQSPEKVGSCRYKIRLFDSAMSLECAHYGPNRIVPKEKEPRTLSKDGRIIRMAENLVGPLEAFSGHSMSAHPHVVLRNLPLSPLNIVDLLVTRAGALFTFAVGKKRLSYNRRAVAILIHPREHYSSPLLEKRLIGAQKMRDRHFRLLGFHVVHLALDDLYDATSNRETLSAFFERHLRVHLEDCCLSWEE